MWDGPTREQGPLPRQTQREIADLETDQVRGALAERHIGTGLERRTERLGKSVLVRVTRIAEAILEALPQKVCGVEGRGVRVREGVRGEGAGEAG